MILELSTKEVEKELEKKIRLDTVADLREGPPGGPLFLGKNFLEDLPPPHPLISESGSATVTGNRTLIIAMTGRNALSIEANQATWRASHCELFS